jgi:MYXO-CTERM domain-containing protein
VKPIARKSHALLAAALLVGVPGAAVAKDQVAAQANKVAAEAKDLQQATNSLDATVANSQDNDRANAKAYDNDKDRDGDRHHDGDDDLGKWGLLGLLGLAGLLGLRRRDHDHVHYDRRDDLAATRPGSRTGAGPDTTDTRL